MRERKIYEVYDAVDEIEMLEMRLSSVIDALNIEGVTDFEGFSITDLNYLQGIRKLSTENKRLRSIIEGLKCLFNEQKDNCQCQACRARMEAKNNKGG